MTLKSQARCYHYVEAPNTISIYIYTDTPYYIIVFSIIPILTLYSQGTVGCSGCAPVLALYACSLLHFLCLLGAAASKEEADEALGFWVLFVPFGEAVQMMCLLA